ncbi:hypothetical protein ACIQCG_00955 [Streptomyces noursei]|uniref:hypothetical protein n=1 Tax=Streptomyces noursei TaxID=1971 RepID=UPI00382F0B3B
MQSTYARAASLVAAALDAAYDGDDAVTLSVHNATTGSVMTAIGRTSDESRRAPDAEEQNPIDFDPKDLEALLRYLTRLLTTPMPKGAISVRVPDAETDGQSLWSWDIATHTPLRPHHRQKATPAAVDLPTSSRAYDCLTDQTPPRLVIPRMPLSQRAATTLIYYACT